VSSRLIRRRFWTNLLVIAAVVSLGAMLVTACGGEEDEGEDGSREASGFFSWLADQGYETIEEAKAGFEHAIAAAQKAVSDSQKAGRNIACYVNTSGTPVVVIKTAVYSIPGGTSVSVDGKALTCQTPCALYVEYDQAGTGIQSRTLALKKDGYADFTTSLAAQGIVQARLNPLSAK
jgi:hypothetical protein